MKPENKGAKVAGLGGCLPSLVLAVSATTSSINYNLAATFLSLGFGIFGVIGLISAYSKTRGGQQGKSND